MFLALGFESEKFKKKWVKITITPWPREKVTVFCRFEVLSFEDVLRRNFEKFEPFLRSLRRREDREMFKN